MTAPDLRAPPSGNPDSRGMDREALRKREGARNLSRLGAMFFAPGRAFAELRDSPAVAAVLIATALAAAAAAGAITWGTDLEAVARYQFDRQMEEMPGSFGRMMSEADREAAFEASRRALQLSRRFAPVLAVIGAIVAPLIAAAVYLLVFGILGNRGTYRTILSTLLHANWPVAATQAALVTIVVWLSRPLAPERMEEPLRTSLAGLAPEGSGLALTALLSRFDLFAAWYVFLAGIGLAATLSLTRGRAFGVVLGLWALATAAVVGFALLLSAIPGVRVNL